jgi:signal transduction histidine kinase
MSEPEPEPAAPARLRRVRASVRLRVTAFATLAFAVAFTAAAIGLVETVQRSLENRTRDEGAGAVETLARRLEAGERPEQLTFGTTARIVQVLDGDGDVVASTPGADQVLLQAIQRREPPLRVTFVRTSDGQRLLAYRAVVAPAGRYTIAVASPLDAVRRSVDTVADVLWFATPALVALVGALAWLLAGRALHPVELLRTEVDEITHTTMHRRVVVPPGDDEVARLATTMNDMLDRLEGAAERQRQFVADASHELRSPITTMRADLEVALRAPERLDWPALARRMLAENERLSLLVDDLLELARLDEGRPARPRVDVDLDDLVHDEATRASSRVHVDVAGVSAGRVQGDLRQLGQVVRNLVDNAARHAVSRVAVSVVTDATEVVVRVDDDGPGIPEVDRERVFERFARLDEGRAREGGGAGLGLALVRRVVAAHGGAVTVGDAPLGGARFEVRLPTATLDEDSST